MAHVSEGDTTSATTTTIRGDLSGRFSGPGSHVRRLCEGIPELPWHSDAELIIAQNAISAVSIPLPNGLAGLRACA